MRRNEFKDLPREYDLQEQQKILDYCQSDVEELAQLFVAQCLDIENKNKLETEDDFNRALYEILFRGYSQANFAQIERNGFTIMQDLYLNLILIGRLLKIQLLKDTIRI